MKGEYHRITLWLGGAVLVLGGLYYFFVHRHMVKKSEVGSPILRPEAAEGRPKSE
jgi:hypothetical protein